MPDCSGSSSGGCSGGCSGVVERVVVQDRLELAAMSEAEGCCKRVFAGLSLPNCGGGSRSSSGSGTSTRQQR